jgi:hypothetical protein
MLNMAQFQSININQQVYLQKTLATRRGGSKPQSFLTTLLWAALVVVRHPVTMATWTPSPATSPFLGEDTVLQHPLLVRYDELGLPHSPAPMGLHEYQCLQDNQLELRSIASSF